MKRLILVRHGEAEPHRVGDHSRELTAKGRSQAASIGTKLISEIRGKTTIVSSDAARAKSTAEIVSQQLGKPLLQLRDDFYSGNYRQIIDALESHFNNDDTVIVVGHNPGWSEAVEALANHPINLGTADAAVVDLSDEQSKDWQAHLLDFTFTKWIKP